MRTAFFVALLVVAPIATAASFDCTRAGSAVERLICSDRELSDLDNSLDEVFVMEIEREEAATRLRSSQKAWLAARNACSDAACVRHQYEDRLAQLWCNPHGRMSGSAIGANRCAGMSLRIVERELGSLEQRYGRKVSEESNNPEYTLRTLAEEQKTWRTYRAAKCALRGALEGGSDGWKNAFSGMCEVEEAKRRVNELKKELRVK